MGVAVGIGNVVRNISTMWCGISGVARSVDEGYVSLAGVKWYFHQKVVPTEQNILVSNDYGINYAWNDVWYSSSETFTTDSSLREIGLEFNKLGHLLRISIYADGTQPLNDQYCSVVSLGGTTSQCFLTIDYVDGTQQTVDLLRAENEGIHFKNAVVMLFFTKMER